MKNFGILLCILILLGSIPSYAEQQSAKDTQQVLIRMFLLGCLPNAIGVLPFTAKNSDAYKEADLIEGKNVPAHLVKSLALDNDTNVVVSKSLPDNFIIVASPSVNVCRIAVVNMPAADLRAAIIAELENKKAPWKKEKTENDGRILSESYKWHRRNRPTVLVNVSGPPHTSINWSGPQLIIDVGLVKD